MTEAVDLLCQIWQKNFKCRLNGAAHATRMPVCVPGAAAFALVEKVEGSTLSKLAKELQMPLKWSRPRDPYARARSGSCGICAG